MAAQRRLRLPVIQTPTRSQLRLLRDVPETQVDLPGPRLALRAMTRFRCIGSACESNCCSEWSVAIDEPTYHTMGRALADTPSGTIFEESVLRVAAGPNAPYAVIRLTSEGQCPFLSQERMCSVQQAHGESILSDACATYPRATLTVGTRHETGGRLSCPEVARLALLAEDGADLVVMTEPGQEGTRFVEGKTVEDKAHGWTSSFDRVRDLMFALLRRSDLTLSLRVALIADFAARVHPFFSRDDASLAGPRWVFAERRLEHEIAQSTEPGLVEGMCDGFAQLDIPPGPITNLVVSVIIQRTQLSTNRHFDLLVDQVLQGFRQQIAACAEAATDGETLTAEALAHFWLARQTQLDETYGDVVERVFRNWSLVWWTQEAYTTAPTLMDHTIRFGLSLAIVRFLFAGHPRVVSVLAGDLPLDIARQELEAAAVEVARLFSRAFEHDPSFFVAIDESMRAESPHTLGRALCLARMV